MRLLRFVLTTVFVVPGMVVTWGAAPAIACSCAYQDVPDAVAGADEIFAGTLVSMEDPSQQAVMSSADPITYTVAVDSVYRGDIGMATTFESPMSGASCGLEGMVVDRRYLIFLSTDGPDRTASLCDGTRLATPRRMSAVEQLTGAPVRPLGRGQAEETAPVAGSTAWIIAGVAGVAVLLSVWIQRTSGLRPPFSTATHDPL